MATTPTVAKAARALAGAAGIDMQQQAEALAALVDHANGGRCITAREAGLLLQGITDLTAAARVVAAPAVPVTETRRGAA